MLIASCGMNATECCRWIVWWNGEEINNRTTKRERESMQLAVVL